MTCPSRSDRRGGSAPGDGPDAPEAACENCNDCVVLQAAGAPGVYRTPSMLARRGEFERGGAYERPGDD